MERRSDCRHLKFFCPAYIRTDRGIHYAFLRNLSHEGASFFGATDMVAGEEIQYRVGDLEPVKAAVKWVNGKVFGVRNTSMRINDLSLANGYPYRSVRLPMAVPISLYVLGQKYNGLLKDFSQSGACFETSAQLQPGQLISLEFGGLSVEAATVKWANHDRAGIRFSKPLELELITKALRRLNLERPIRSLEPA